MDGESCKCIIELCSVFLFLEQLKVFFSFIKTFLRQYQIFGEAQVQRVHRFFSYSFYPYCAYKKWENSFSKVSSSVGRLGRTQTEQKQKRDGINIINCSFPVLLILYKAEIAVCCLLFLCDYCNFFHCLHSLWIASYLFHIEAGK